MKRLRILLLMHEELVPPDSLRGLPEKEKLLVTMEHDVLGGLRALGHDVQSVGVRDELAPIRTAIEGFEPDVVFNLLMHFHGLGVYDAHVVSYLELLRTPYTGCNPRGLMLCGDKVLAKKVLAWHRIPTPRFASFERGKAVRAPARLAYPLFVKSSAEHSSIGIAQASVVHDADELRERVAFIHRTVGTDALAEEYVEGRELYVGLIGNQRLQALPVWEMQFTRLPAGSEPIATSRVKWDPAYQRKIGVRTGPARLSEDVERRILHLSKRIYRALGLSGFARVDLRLTPEGEVVVLEANPNPDLCRAEDLARSAKRAGLEYEALLQRIVTLGRSWAAPWKDQEQG